MKIKKGKLIMITILSTILTFALFGCQKEEPVSGGTTDKSDPNAPKKIESKDIAEFSINFYHETRKNVNEDHFFEFEIKKDEKDILKASEKRLGITYEADRKLLDDLQSVIDKYELVLQNGHYRITAGLPPEFDPSTLSVIYESGEKLSSTKNNDPSDKYTAAFYDVFAAWFAEKGDDSLYPRKIEKPLARFDIRICEKDIYYEYGPIKVMPEEMKDGQEFMLQKNIYDDMNKKTLEDRLIAIPEDYYQKIDEILNKYDLYRRYEFSYFSHSDGFYGFNEDFDENEEDKADFIDIYIQYEDGPTMNIETRKESEITAMKDLLDDLVTYHDVLFE